MRQRGSALPVILGLIAAGVATVVLAYMLVFGVGWFQRSTADFRGRTAATEKIRANGDYRIAAYDWFFAQCSAVQAQEDRISIFTDDTSATGGANLRAVKATRANLIREYNAKASATATAGQFRDSRLPYQLDIHNEETQCAL